MDDIDGNTQLTLYPPLMEDHQQVINSVKVMNALLTIRYPLIIGPPKPPSHILFFAKKLTSNHVLKQPTYQKIAHTYNTRNSKQPK